MREILIIVDMNNGFTREGVFKNSYQEALIPLISAKAKEFYETKDKDVILVNESHEEESLEFSTFPAHCIKGSHEAEIVDELKWLEEKHYTLEKNATMAFFAPDMPEFLKRLDGAARIYISGGVTDICVLEMAIPLRKYFDQNNLNVEVIVDSSLVDTYDAPWHNRDEYNEIAFKLMRQAGVKVI